MAPTPHVERGRRVVILTPSPIGSNPRVVKEADALHETGYDVTVVATRTHDHIEARDAALMRRIAWRLKRIDLRRPLRWRTHRIMQMAARQMFRASGHAPLADLGGSAFTQPLLWAALRTPADLYIAHYPPALPAAAAAARRYAASHAFDAEDFHPGDCPDEHRYEIERRLIAATERQHLPGAAYVSAASPGIAEAYARTYGLRPPTVALNVFPRTRAPTQPTVRGTAVPAPSLYWFSQTIGPDRGLECAIAAIGLSTARPHLFLRGIVANGYGDTIARLAAEAGASQRVHLLSPAAPDDMERLAAAYDAGLALETGHSLNRRLCLTNKLFSYVQAGVPPLMSDTSAQRAFADEAGLGDLVHPVGDARALARLIDWVLGDGDRLTALRRTVWRLGQTRYNWEQEKGKITERVATALHVADADNAAADHAVAKAQRQ